jgi:hypothetical protein
MYDRSGWCKNQNQTDLRMIRLLSQVSLKRPGAMSKAEVAMWVQIGKPAVFQTFSHHDIQGVTGYAKKGH